MKKIVLTILILFVCNLSYAQLFASIDEVKANNNTEPFLSDYTSDGYYFLAYNVDNDREIYYYFAKNNICFLYKMVPLDQEDIPSMVEFFDKNYYKRSNNEWVKNEDGYRLIMKKVLFEDGGGYYIEYSLEKD